MPFFPRILKHFVGLGDGIGQGVCGEREQSLLLNAFAEFVQRLTSEGEFASEFRGGHALGESAQQQDNRRGPFVGGVEHGVGEGVEDAPAAGRRRVRATAIAENRRPFATVHAIRVGRPATRTTQPVRVKERDEFVVTGLLVHQRRDREVHGCRP